jgi:hexosaminidase
MKRLTIAIILAASAGLSALADAASIIPQPAVYTATVGTYLLPAELSISASTKNASASAKELVSALKMRGLKAKIGASASANIHIGIDSTLPTEGYTLNISASGINITVANSTGAFYAAQSLVQIIGQASNGKIAAATITDEPRFAYRGMMIDVTRCFLPFEELKKLTDMASQLKINNLHLHLTDDNGWRIEIKHYPKLTEVGAWRVDRDEIFPARSNATADEKATYGGFYTQKQMRELVKYAAERHVNIIPEIEMPAHAVAAMASYPELTCPVVDKFIGVLPGIGGKDASIIACAGNEKTFEFYQNVLDEIMSIFPSKYIHLGGDEANKANWEKCPLCHQRLIDEGLNDYEELQGYFMDRINRYVISKGRKAFGWDEVTYGKPKEDITVLGWLGDGNNAIKYARETGRNIILTPAKKMYLIRYQGPQWFEPFTYFGNITLADVYNYEPCKADWDDQLRSQLLGIQGSMWTEFCRSSADVEYMMFPRMLAVADVAWRPECSANWPAFVKAVDTFLPTLDKYNVTYARSMYNLDHKVMPNANGTLSVTLNCIRPDVEIRWADNSEFNNAQTYNEAITIDHTSTLYAATFSHGQQIGQTLILPLEFNKATGRSVQAENCRNGIAYTLTNGLRGSDKNSDFEWAGWYNSPADFTIDLGADTQLHRISIGALANSDICIAAPMSVYVYTSTNGNSYTLLKRIDVDADKIFAKRANHLELSCDATGIEARYVRITAVNPGCIPDGMPRETTPTWMYFDEVSVD